MTSKKLTRRDFLRMGAMGVAGAALAGCRPTAEPATEPAATKPATEAAPTEKPEPTEVAGPITIKIFAPQNVDQDMTTNAFTQLLEDKFNVKFEWTITTMDGASAKEKRNLALASGDYPDIFMLIPWVDQFSQIDLLKYGEQGVFVPLNDLIDQHGPNIKAAMEEKPDYKAISVAPDGNIWGLPQFVECYHCSYGNKMWINTTWLETLNLEPPKTTEEFKAVLEAFKTQDPNGNGKTDEIPLSGAVMSYGTRPIPYLMDGFVYDDDRTYLYMNNGQVDTIANKPEYKEGLAYIKELWDAGLIDQGAFTNVGEVYNALGNNADAELLGAAAGMHPNIFTNCFGDSKPYCYDYDALPPLQGPHANYSTYIPGWVPGATFVITNKASEEVQIAAIKMVDYTFTFEGHMNGIFGIEGVNWREPEAGEVANDPSVEPLYKTLTSGVTNNAWQAMAQYWDPKEIRLAWVQSPDIYTDGGYNHRLYLATQLYDGKESPDLFPFWRTWPDPEVADEQALLKTNIDDYINENALAFITGSKSLEDDWDDYVAGLDALDLARYLEINQKAYDSIQQ